MNKYTQLMAAMVVMLFLVLAIGHQADTIRALRADVKEWETVYEIRDRFHCFQCPVNQQEYLEYCRKIGKDPFGPIYMGEFEILEEGNNGTSE